MEDGWRRIGAVLVAGTLMLGAGGCAGDERPADPSALSDPCQLITDEVLARLAPGSTRELKTNGSGGNGSLRCTVDLTSGPASMRGDLEVGVAVNDSNFYGREWWTKRCQDIGTTPVRDGPGDQSCLAVTPWDGAQARIDGWAWVGDDYEVNVVYQLIEPQILPVSAEHDLSTLLAAAVESLPT